MPFRFRHVCPSCGTRFAFSNETSQKVGATIGLLYGLTFVPLAFVFDPAWIRSWPFWVALVVFNLFAGAVVPIMVIGRLTPYEEVRRTRWDLFPNVSGRPRTFLLLQLCVIPVCAALLLFARWLPFWAVMLVSLVIIVVGTLGFIGTWHLLFGARGIFGRRDPNAGA